MLVAGLGSVLAGGMLAVADDTAARPAASGNPYLPISERNAFGIKPPVVPEVVVPPPPPPPPANIFLTGITTLGGVRKAYLVRNLANGKTPEYLTVTEGYDGDGLKVLGINPRDRTVKLVNGTVEQTLNFKDNALKASGPAPGGPPGMPPPGGPRGNWQPPQHANAGPGPGAEGPTIIGRRRQQQQQQEAETAALPSFQPSPATYAGGQPISGLAGGQALNGLGAAGAYQGAVGGVGSVAGAVTTGQPTVNTAANQSGGGNEVGYVPGTIVNQPTQSGRTPPPVPNK